MPAFFEICLGWESILARRAVRSRHRRDVSFPQGVLKEIFEAKPSELLWLDGGAFQLIPITSSLCELERQFSILLTGIPSATIP